MDNRYSIFLAKAATHARALITDYEGVLAAEIVPEHEQGLWHDYISYQREVIADVERLLSDADLLAAYQRTDGEPGNPEADALAAEIERRGLNI